MIDTETSFLREQQKQETKNVDSFYRLLKGIHGVAAKYCQSEDETVRTHGQDIIKSMECLINKQINIRLFYERVTRLINDDDDVVKQLRDPTVEKFIIDTFQTFYNHARRGEIKLEFNNYIIKMNDNLDNYADMECIRPLLDNILDSFTSLPRKTLSYFNVVVEVISVFETERASTVLRVWDGDLHKLSPNVFSADESIIATYCFERDPAYDAVQRNRYIDITLYGDHIRKAKTLWPGDIILISNLHFALPNNSNMQVFTLHSGTMGSYRRGIYHVPVSEMEFTALRLKTKETLEKLTKAKENVPMRSEAQALPNPAPKPLPQKVEGKPRSVDPAVIAIKNAQKAQVPAEKRRSSSTSAINNKSTTTTTTAVVDKPPEAPVVPRDEASTSTTTTTAVRATTTSPPKNGPNKMIMKTSPASAPPSPMVPPQKKASPSKAPTVVESVRSQAPPTEAQKTPVKTTVSDPLPMGPPKRPPMSNARKLALMKILEHEPDNNLPLWRPPTPEEPLMEDGLPRNHWSRTFVYAKEEWPPFTLERCLALAREAGLVWNPNEDNEKEEQEKKRKEDEARKKKLEEEEAERKRQELEEKAREEEEAKKQKELEEKKRLELEEVRIEAEKKKEEANKRKKDLEEKRRLELEEKKKKLEEKEREKKRTGEEKRVRQEEKVRIMAEKKKRGGQQEEKIATRVQSESEQSQSSSSSVVILSEVPSTSKPPAPIVRVLPTRCKAPIIATQFSEDIFDTDGEEDEDDEIILHTRKAGTSESVEIIEPPTRPTVEVQPRRRSNRLSGANEPTTVVEPPKALSQDFEEPPAKRAKRGSDHRSNLLVIPKTSKSPVPPTVVITSSATRTTTRQQVNNGDIEILEERLAPTEVNTFLLARIKPEVIVNNTRSLSTLSSRSRRSQHSPLSTRLNELSTEINCQAEVNNGGGGDNGAIDNMPKQQQEPKVAIHVEVTQQEGKVRVPNLSTSERQQQQQPPAHVATPPRSSPKKYNFRNPKQEKAIDYTPQLTIVSSDTNGSNNIIRTTTSTNSTASTASTETKPMTKTSAHPEKDQQFNQQQQPPVNVPPPVISPATRTVVPRKPGRYRENGRLVKKTNEPFVSSPPSKRPLARKMVAMPSFDPTRITRSGRRISPAYVTQPKKARLG